MKKSLAEEKRDFLFKTIYGETLEEMFIEDDEDKMFEIAELAGLSNYDNSGTFFILPVKGLDAYNLYRITGSGKLGFDIEELGCIDLKDTIIFDKVGNCKWKKYKKDYNLLKDTVDVLKARYNFNGLYHFTDFSNLKNIFEDGYLRSRNECEYSGISFIDGAASSVMSHTAGYVKDCVRFYYRPKTPTLYVNEGIKLQCYINNPHIPIPVYLVFDEELIYLDTTWFTDRNAGCTDVNIDNDAHFFNNIKWDKVFNGEYYIKEDKNIMQAELLSRVPVSLDYLKKIVFRCEIDKERATNLFGYDDRYYANIDFFSEKNNRHTPCRPEHENNFISYYKIAYEKPNSLKVKLYFQKEWIDYETDIIIKDKKGEIIKTSKFNRGICKNMDKPFLIETELNGFNEKWHKLEVYLNGILSVEESLKRYR
ncbi:MAG TPA: DUF4433 domain-containing protein [Tissierellia bacterium]|nr:DUF4433 domain-containing protein [Tissierellia bacterium]